MSFSLRLRQRLSEDAELLPKSEASQMLPQRKSAQHLHSEKDIVDATQKELLDRSQQLLNSIDQQDWDMYTRLCDPNLTAFEPEGVGNVIEGMAFHKFYFDLEASGLPKQSTISSPLIRVIGDCAVITYIRVCQRLNADGGVPSSAFEETRIWEKQNGEWKHIHFHRSAPGA